MQVQVGNYIYPLVEGQPLLIQAGQALRVFFSFSYKVAETTTIPIWASLYQRVAGIVNRVEAAQTKTTITLDKAIVWQTFEGYVDIAIGSGVKPGIYGLIVELPGFADADERIDDSIEVAAAPGVMDWMGPLLMIAMVGMLAQTTQGME